MPSFTFLDLVSRDFEPPRFLAPGLLAEGVTLLAGRPKSGKSWLSLQISAQAATSQPLLGRFPAERGVKVLYFALEESPRRTALRATQLATEPCDGLENICFHYQLDPLLTGGAAFIDRQLTDHCWDLIVIDTLVRVVQSSPRGDVLRADYAEVNVLRQLAEKHKAAILLVCHTRKQVAASAVDAVIGATGLTAACDALWWLQRRPDGSASLNVLGREIEQHTIPLVFRNQPPLGWSIADHSDEPQLNPTRQHVLSILQRNGPMKPAAVAGALSRNRAGAAQLLARMERAGLLHRNSDGLYSPPQS